MISHIGQPDFLSICFFLFFIAITLVITYWAARKTRGADEFFTAGRQVTGLQNGLALAGDFISASSFLGFTGLIALNGFDGLIYPIGGLMGWPLVLFLLAEPLRNLGKYTFADVLAFRLREKPIRITAAISSLSVIFLYMIAQMIGAGHLIKLMFGLSYDVALVIVGTAMICYVMFGGMIATTWVQIIKAVLLIMGVTILAGLVLAQYAFNPLNILREATAQFGEGILKPGKLYPNPLDAISLGLAFMFGTAGLPHILMRFYTVQDAKAARSSAYYATGFIAFFYVMIFILGFGAMVVVGPDLIKTFDKGGNMAALIMAEAVGGTAFLGIISAIAFATILAVVAGLTLTGAATLSHDIWVQVIRKGKSDSREEMRVARISTVILGVIAMGFGMMFKGQNVAILVGLAFSIAASGNFPAIIMASFWRRATTEGMVASIGVGTLSSLLLIYLSPTVQIDILGHAEAIFPLKNPGIVTIPLSFAVGIITSLLTRDLNSERNFTAMERQMLLGQGEQALSGAGSMSGSKLVKFEAKKKYF